MKRFSLVAISLILAGGFRHGCAQSKYCEGAGVSGTLANARYVLHSFL